MEYPNMDQITLIHVTSSINKNQILEKGLVATRYIESDVAKHIQFLQPNANELLERVLNEKCGASALLRARLNDDIARLSFMSETSDKYYKNICDCVRDGGEFYAAVRFALEAVTSNSINPPYPEAYPIICKANFNTYLDDDGCRHVVVPEQVEDIKLPDQQHIEISLNVNLNPSNFSMHDVKYWIHR